jgi:hypothetical protein
MTVMPWLWRSTGSGRSDNTTDLIRHEAVELALLVVEAGKHDVASGGVQELRAVGRVR